MSDLKDKMGLRGDVVNPGPSKPIPSRDRHTMALEVTVDATPQKLTKKLRSFAASMLRVPGNLSGEAKIVLQALFACFEKQKVVKEGLIGDLLWGFEQATPPIPAECTFNGLVDLQQRGYVKFQAPDNTYVDARSDQIGRAWLRYTDKLLDMVYEGESPKLV